MLYNRDQSSRAARMTQRGAMKSLCAHRATLIKAGMLYPLLICLLISASFLGSPPGFAQTSKRATRVHSTAGSKEGRSDVARFTEPVEAGMVYKRHDEAF